MEEEIVAYLLALVMFLSTRAPPAKSTDWNLTDTSRATAHKPDNIKAAVKDPSRYEPVLNETYADLLDHYRVDANVDSTVLPSRTPVAAGRDAACHAVVAARGSFARVRNPRPSR